MAFDFPTSPTEGQMFTPSGGPTYVFHSPRWDVLSGPGFISMGVVQQVFTATGTYTPTSGMVFCVAEMVGGGGGGGGCLGATGTTNSAGGGASGTYTRSRLTAAQVGASQAVTVGAQGNGGASGNNNGQAGTQSSLGSLVTAPGGGGGTAVNGTGAPGAGGTAGAAGTGDVSVPGSNGRPGTKGANATEVISSGDGAGSFFGSGPPGVGPTTAVATAGIAAAAYGAGGSGAGFFNIASNAAGGNGKAGIVIITEYLSQAVGAAQASINFIIEGGGSVITTGVKGYIEIPFSATFTQWTLLADVSGSIVVDVWKDTYANYPPVVGDVITGTDKPTITTATKGQSSALTGWTTTVNAGDILAFNVNSATTITRVTLSLKMNKT